MEPFLYHVFLCDQKKPEGVPSCSACGSAAVLDALRREIATEGMIDEVQLTTCGSLGLCEHGPNLVVYPEGVWYSGVHPQDIPEIVRSHFKEGAPVERLIRTDTSQLRAEILANREKREAAMKAQNAVGALPEDLMQTIRGFQESRALLTAIELDLFSAVGSGATSEQVAAARSIDPRAAGMLMHALVALGLLEKRNGTFHNTRTGSRYLDAGSPDNAREALLHIVHLWWRWSTLTDAVRSGTSVIEQETGERRRDWTHAFIAAMDRIASERVPLVVRTMGLQGVKRMLDVGGGSGAYSIAFARTSPDLEVEVLDLPDVLPLTDSYIEKAGMSGRIRTRPGDLRADALGSGFDLVFVSAICHMLSPEENHDLIRRCYEALSPGGRLVVQDFVLDHDRTSPKFAALFALNMLVGTRAGSSYNIDDFSAWFEAASFRDVMHIRMPGPTSLIAGTRR